MAELVMGTIGPTIALCENVLVLSNVSIGLFSSRPSLDMSTIGFSDYFSY